MSTINLDLSQKVDLICREGDDFFLNIGAQNENGSAIEIHDDSILLFTIKDLKNIPIKLFATTRKASSNMDDLVRGFNSSVVTEEIKKNYEKRAVALQKIINSREINATAYSDIYHPLLKQESNSLIGGLNQPYDVYTRETSDKIWFSSNPNFSENPGNLNDYALDVSITYDVSKKIITLNCDAVTFDLPFGKYRYDIKLISGLYCPLSVTNNEPVIEEAIYESVTTLIFGTLDVKKD